MTTIALSTDEQREAFESALEEIRKDDSEGFVDVKRNDRGKRAGEIQYGEVIRIVCKAYTGSLE